MRLAFEALEKGGTAPAVLNAANEIAVEAFLNEDIGMAGIYGINSAVLERHNPSSIESLQTVLDADREAREVAKGLVSGFRNAAAV